ncbi:MAG: NAD(P)H-hydrate dehydratase [Bacteroidota bacterium]
MKIFSVEQIRAIDKHTIEQEPILSIDLMERAALACSNWLVSNFEPNKNYFIFCGKGNNGCDGLAIARILLKNNFNVQVFVFNEDKRSADNQTNFDLLKQNFPNCISVVNDVNDLKRINFTNSVCVDALLGTGLTTEITGIYHETIAFLNTINCTKVAIDMPSGLFADALKVQKQTVFKANFTLSFQFPKLAFLFLENYQFVGNFILLDIKLNQSLFQNHLPEFCYTDVLEIHELNKIKTKFSHKGTNGHALLIVGSNDKTGAAVLSANATLKSGCGLVTVASTANTILALQANLPEAMCVGAGSEEYITELPKLEKYNALAIGCGIGLEKQTANVLKLLIQDAKIPMVIDADAITLLAENKTWLSFLPANTILTPHIKELERLIGKCADSFERLEKTKQFVLKYNCIVIIKGAHTAIAAPNAPIYFNSTGNAVMAKGGSGDVLTGLITGLLAQGYSPWHAAIIAVYKHGAAADYLVENQNFNSILPSHLCEYF